MNYKEGNGELFVLPQESKNREIERRRKKPKNDGKNLKKRRETQNCVYSIGYNLVAIKAKS